MRPELLRRIRQLVSEGGVILGAPPAHSPSLENFPQADRDVAALAAELWKNCDGSAQHAARFGQGRVFRNVDLEALFAELRVPADLSPVVPFIHRHTPEGDLYFLSNQTDEAVTKELAFRVTGLQPELWDAVNGTRRDLPNFRSANGVTTIALTFAPRESHFVVFRHPAAAPSEKPNFPELKTLAEVAGPWQVNFNPEFGGPGTVTFTSLADWTTRPEPGIRSYSGTAVYRTTFDAPAAAGPVYLDLGSVTSLARVRLNGKDLGTIWCAPWRLEVSSALHSGANQLELEVTNTWLNRILGDRANPSAPPIAPTTVTISPHAKPIPAGLFGPVRLRTQAR
jgi:hypothetical protein